MQSQSFGTFHVGKSAECTQPCCVPETGVETRRRILEDIGQRKILRVSRVKSTAGRARPEMPPIQKPVKRERSSDTEESETKRSRLMIPVGQSTYMSLVAASLYPAGVGGCPLPEEDERDESPEPCTRCRHD